MVKYGTKLKGFNVDKLVIDLTDPIKNCKFHLLTDRPLYENNIRNIGLSDNDIRTHQHWVKNYFFDPEFIGAEKEDETIIVDIDMFWMNDPSRVINFPIEHNQFASMPRWWSSSQVNSYPISGNYYKFKSHDFKHVASIYKSHHQYFRKYYWEKGLVERPDLGEQHFVYDMIKDADIKLQPAEWCMKESPDDPQRYIHAFNKYTGKNYFDHYDQAIWTHVRKVNI